MSFKACVSLFIFILDDLSIGVSEVLKSFLGQDFYVPLALMIEDVTRYDILRSIPESVQSKQLVSAVNLFMYLCIYFRRSLV